MHGAPGTSPNTKYSNLKFIHCYAVISSKNYPKMKKYLPNFKFECIVFRGCPWNPCNQTRSKDKILKIMFSKPSYIKFSFKILKKCAPKGGKSGRKGLLSNKFNKDTLPIYVRENGCNPSMMLSKA